MGTATGTLTARSSVSLPSRRRARSMASRSTTGATCELSSATRIFFMAGLLSRRRRSPNGRAAELQEGYPSRLRRPRPGRDEIAQVGAQAPPQPREQLLLDLAHALAAQPERGRDGLQRRRALREPALAHDGPLARVEIGIDLREP